MESIVLVQQMMHPDGSIWLHWEAPFTDEIRFQVEEKLAITGALIPNVRWIEDQATWDAAQDQDTLAIPLVYADLRIDHRILDTLHSAEDVKYAVEAIFRSLGVTREELSDLG